MGWGGCGSHMATRLVGWGRMRWGGWGGHTGVCTDIRLPGLTCTCTRRPPPPCCYSRDSLTRTCTHRPPPLPAAAAATACPCSVLAELQLQLLAAQHGDAVPGGLLQPRHAGPAGLPAATGIQVGLTKHTRVPPSLTLPACTRSVVLVGLMHLGLEHLGLKHLGQF